MRLFSFLLFYKALSFLVALASSCSPEINDGNLIAISLSISNIWRFNINNIIPNVGANVITWNSDVQPDDNEIFMLKQSTTGVYEFRPFNDFSRTKIIEGTNIVGDPLKLNIGTNGDNQKFFIECDKCNLDTNSEKWVKYHSSCQIKNSATKLCASGKDNVGNVTQINCATDPKWLNWDLFGMLSPDVPKNTLSPTTTSDSPTIANSTSGVSTSGISMGVISANGLIAAVFGSIIGSALISFMVAYWVIKRKQLSQNELLTKNDPVNVQVIYN
ncbi:unnamed protein product [Rhizophagus irregularis]|nr:unnamed protein product [Rhizophagus irregularis]CAB5383367.1 unnamed protein product [Rhizophagus irregularis]